MMSVGGALRVDLGCECRDTEGGGRGAKRGNATLILGEIGVDGAIKKPLCSGLCCISDKRFLLKGCQYVFYDSSHLIP